MKKKPITPRSKIKAALHRLWLYSRERSLALKLSGNRCLKCGVKASKEEGKEQKIQVHHIAGIGNWDKVIKLIKKELLVSPDKLISLCPKCHSEEHDGKARNPQRL